MKAFTADAERSRVGAHQRWHVRRGKPDPACPLCIAERLSLNVLGAGPLLGNERGETTAPTPALSTPNEEGS